MKILFVFILFFVSFSSLFSQALKTYFATQVHITQTNPATIDTAVAYRILDSIKAAGITFIRDECLWSEVEKSQGVYYFSPAVDSFVLAAKKRGIDMLLILDYNNAIYCGNFDPGTGPITDANRIAYANYCKAMVSHFSPLGVKHYELWNEPNIPNFWKPTPNANDYVALIQTAYPAIKQVDSNVVVLGCATSPAEGNPAPFIMWKTFIQRVWLIGGGNFMDGISFHQYRVDKTPENYLLADIQSLQAIVGTTKPIYITEIGYHTASVWPNTTLTKQAYYVGKLYIIGRAIPQLKSILYYDFRNDGENAAEPEHNFGLIYNNLIPKPAYIAYKTVNKILADKNYVNHTVNGTYYKYNYSNGIDVVNSFFSSDATTLLKPEIFTTSALKFQSLLGEPYYIYDKDKIVNINYVEEPLFVTSLNALPPLNSIELLPKIDTIIAGQKVTLSLSGKTAEGYKVLIDNQTADWNFSNSNAKIDSNGVVTALKSGTGIITVIFNGVQTQTEIVIIASQNYYEIEKFDNLNRLTPSFNAMLPETSLNITDTNYTSPDKSLLINYAFKYEAIDRHRVIFDCDYALYGEPDTILIDIYNNNNGHVVEFQIADKDNEIFKVNTGQVQAKYGWLTARAKLTGFGSKFDFPCRLKKIVFYCVKSGGIKDSVYSGQVLLDNIRIHNSITTEIKNETLPEESISYFLEQNYPNPFNPTTSIKFNLNKETKVKLIVYDILGNIVDELINENKPAGSHIIFWNSNDSKGNKVSSGVYFYRLEAGEFVQAKKMILVK